ncbi:MAG: hypothetical protein A4E45_00047 [Methanosaeta sp. PtaB.Bin039]|nr:MAG: hypothetical protein A4E45_00047 [Methanosaeta sp. PtaB.Bin039]
MSTLLDEYLAGLGESVTWKSRTSVDQYNDPTFSTSSITVIWFDDYRKIRTEGGEELEQFAYAMTSSAVEVGDYLTRDGYSWPVIGIQKTPFWSGEQFRVVNLGMRMV